MNDELSQSLVYLDHAKERMEQRGITPGEVEEALNSGSAVPGKLPGRIKILGTTAAGRRLDITRLENFMAIVSVVDLAGSGE
jgi:uncharacterized protein DUF4258